jgi:hypothetical protein
MYNLACDKVDSGESYVTFLLHFKARRVKAVLVKLFFEIIKFYIDEYAEIGSRVSFRYS